MEIKKVKETCLYLSDLDRAKRFYIEKLGLPLISEDEGAHVFLRAGSSVLLLFNPDNSAKKNSPPPHFAHGDQHIAFEVSGEEYETWKTKLHSHEITIIDEITWANGKKSFYFHDPEGNVLEILPPGVWE